MPANKPLMLESYRHAIASHDLVVIHRAVAKSASARGQRDVVERHIELARYNAELTRDHAANVLLYAARDGSEYEMVQDARKVASLSDEVAADAVQGS